MRLPSSIDISRAVLLCGGVVEHRGDEGHGARTHQDDHSAGANRQVRYSKAHDSHVEGVPKSEALDIGRAVGVIPVHVGVASIPVEAMHLDDLGLCFRSRGVVHQYARWNTEFHSVGAGNDVFFHEGNSDRVLGLEPREDEHGSQTDEQQPQC